MVVNYTYYKDGEKHLTKTPEEIQAAVQKYDNNRSKRTAKDTESRRNARGNDPQNQGGQAI